LATPNLDRLLAQRKFGLSLALPTSRALAQCVSRAQGGLVESVRVVGSNGKGSTAELLTRLFSVHGLKIGTFTSPHLLTFNERIRVDGVPVPMGEIEAAAGRLAATLDASGSPVRVSDCVSFELITALAGLVFTEQGCDLAVMEAGIGGRYDPVRCWPGRTACLTSIDLEHTELLGDTREKILFDKLDVLDRKRGDEIFVLPALPEGLLGRAEAVLDLKGIAALRAGTYCAVDIERRSLSGLDLSVRLGTEHISVSVPWLSAVQAGNLATALETAGSWLLAAGSLARIEDLGPRLPEALAQVSLPGRAEALEWEGVPVILDVGHTPQTADALAADLQALKGKRPLCLVVGVSESKAVEQIIRGLYPCADHVIGTRARHKGAPTARVAAALQACGVETPIVTECLNDALAAAKAWALEHGGMIAVAGGLFLAMEAKTLLTGGDPAALAFY